jgi:hypothetical protein
MARAKPKEKAPSHSWTSFQWISVVVFPLAMLLGTVAYASLTTRIGDIDKKGDKIDDRIVALDSRLRALEASIAEMRGELKYRQAAAKLGFVNPVIQSIDLRSGSTFSARGFTQDGEPFDFRYHVLMANQEKLVLGFDGRIGRDGSRGIFEGVILNIDIANQLGKLVPINFTRPLIYIAVLEQPDPDRAIVALGPVERKAT